MSPKIGILEINFTMNEVAEHPEREYLILVYTMPSLIIFDKINQNCNNNIVTYLIIIAGLQVHVITHAILKYHLNLLNYISTVYFREI